MPSSGKEMIKEAEKLGWTTLRVKGSHHQMTHENFDGVYPIANHTKELAPHLEKKIYKIIRSVEHE